MAAVGLSPLYNQLLDYLVEKATPEEILAFKIDSAIQERADELTELNKTGDLTPQDAAELEQMIELSLLIGSLRVKALKALKAS